MTKTATGKDADGNIVTMVYEGDLTISNIDPNDEHTVTTVDTNSKNDRVDFIGGRPNDR